MSISDELKRIVDAKEELKLAINNKGGNLTDEHLEEYASAVNALDVESANARIRFIDYDGTILKEEDIIPGGAPVPPDAPEHDELIFLGWNCDFESPTGSLDVGAVYTTKSGCSEFDVVMRPTTGYTVTFFPAVESGILTIDWGDGSDKVEVTTRETVSYTYADYGKYTVKFSISEDGSWYPYQYFAGNTSNGNYWLIGARLAGIKNIYSRAFYQNYSLRECVLCDGIETIDSNAFDSCRHLVAIVIPDSVTSIGNYCFEYCYSMLRAVWGEGCTRIGYYMFRDCNSLESFCPPDGITYMDQEIFYNCYALQRLRLPETVETLGAYLCENCYSLNSVEVPASASILYNYLFYNCYSVSKFVWRSPEAIPEQVCYNAYNLKSIEITEDITTIGSYAFYNCDTLRFLELPDSVNLINQNAFQNCYSLTKLKLGTNLTTISNSSFNSCYSLEELELPSAIQKINDSAFYNCRGLRELTFPKELATIGNQAFRYCYALRNIHCKRTEPPTLGGGDVFTAISQDCTIWVPKSENREVLTAYKTASNWSNYADYMAEEED